MTTITTTLLLVSSCKLYNFKFITIKFFVNILYPTWSKYLGITCLPILSGPQFTRVRVYQCPRVCENTLECRDAIPISCHPRYSNRDELINEIDVEENVCEREREKGRERERERERTAMRTGASPGTGLSRYPTKNRHRYFERGRARGEGGGREKERGAVGCWWRIERTMELGWPG